MKNIEKTKYIYKNIKNYARKNDSSNQYLNTTLLFYLFLTFDHCLPKILNPGN